MDVELDSFQRQLQVLDGQIAEISQSELGLDEYFRLFLDKTVAVLGVGGAIWRVLEEGQLGLLCHMNLAMAGMEQGGRQAGLMSRAITRVLETGAAVVLPGNAGTNVYDGGLGKDGENDSPHTLLFVPIGVAGEITAVFLLISPAEVDPRAVRGYLGFVMGLCARAGEYLQREKIKELQEQLKKADRLREYVSSLHSSLDPRRTCYALANYVQEILGVYRCMAGTYDSRGKFKMESVSGLESVASKSRFIKNISEIAKHVCRNGKPLLVDNPEAVKRMLEGKDNGSGQLQIDSSFDGEGSIKGISARHSGELVTAARLYMLDADTLVLGVFPIFHNEKVVGALVVEKAVEEPFNKKQRKQIEALINEAGSALDHSIAYRRLPLSPLIRAIASLRDKLYRMAWPKKVMVITLVAAIVIAPFIIPMQVKVIGTAELMPVKARTVYVAQKGIVESVSVPANRHVKKGELLVSLDKRAIDSEIDRVTNSIAEARLALQQAQGSGQATQAKRYQFALAALQAELNKDKIQRDQYDIRAPIAGVIITSPAEIRQLMARPVDRGQPIMEIVPANPDTPWELRVHIPEDEAGDLLKAYSNLAPGRHLKAKIIMKVNPDKTFVSNVLSVSRRAFVMDNGPMKYRNVIEVRVKEPQQMRNYIEPRQGLEGKVAVECGQRNLFYVVTHDFVDFIRISLF